MWLPPSPNSLDIKVGKTWDTFLGSFQSFLLILPYSSRPGKRR
eukprot:07896.XXX_380127_380276_1 [CDS] Oithona nana genome sequencing.